MRTRLFPQFSPSILLGLMVLAGTLTGAPAWALTFAGEEQLNLGEDQVIADSWYAAGREVQIAGTVRRDALVAGVQLNFTGSVEQDLMALAENGSFAGTVAGDMRVAGETLFISTKVGQGAILFAARELHIGPGAMISEGLVAGAQKVTLSGVVHGRTEIYANDVQLEGVLDGDVTVHCLNLRVGSSARVLGTLTYYANKPLQMAPGAQARQVTWISGQKAAASKNWYESFSGKGPVNYFFKLLFAATFLLLGTVLVMILPDSAQRYATGIQAKFWPNLGWGLLILFGVPLASLLFVLTLVGIPLAIILVVLYLLGLFLSKLGVGYMLGRLMFKRQPAMHPVPVFLVGYAFLAAVGFIPVLGSIVGWLAVVLGLGGLTAFLAKTPAVAPAAPQPLAVPPVPAPPVESTSAPMPIKVEVAGTVKRVKKVTTVRRARKPAVKKARPAVRKRSRR